MWEHAFIPPLSCPVRVEVHAYYKGPKPDLSGCLESVGDCLEGIIWANDGEIMSWDGSRVHHDLDNPRTEVIVKW
jgi:Holliday junction resolvase RusA-like endonuclease